MASPLQHLVDWLAQTQASQTIKEISWIIPTVQTIHILAIAAVVGSMVLLDLRVLGIAARAQSLSSVSERLLPWVWRALIVLLLTGIVMVTGEPGRSLVNSIFQIKMALVIVAAVLTFFLQRSLRARGAAEAAPADAKAIAALSLVTWVLIVFAGRWIAYGDTLFGGGS
ncbi:MAG: DUF6644 family protein [Alphaproteobacteria bacterium]